MQEAERKTIFISYSHKDKKWLERLHVMLKPLTRSGALAVWDDTRIAPGRVWREEIENALTTASVAVLLVSPHFLASDFIHQNELPPLLEAAQRDGLRVLWIAVSPSLYQESPIGKFQPVNDPEKPLDRYEHRESKLNEELLKIVNQIKAASIRGTSHEDLTGLESLRKQTAIPEPSVSALPSHGGNGARSRIGDRASTESASGRRTFARPIIWLSVTVMLFLIAFTWFALRMSIEPASSANITPGQNALISAATARNLEYAINELITSLSSIVTDKEQLRHTHPWMLGQVVVSVSQLVKFDDAEIAHYMQSKMIPGCNCWAETEQPHMATSSWVMLSLAKVDSTAHSGQIDFFLNTQARDGWWAMSPAADDPRNASAYATSWAVLILDEYLRKQRITTDAKPRVEEAIRRGRQWLLKTNIEGKARWRDYPESKNGVESVSDSALVLHVLHRLSPPPDMTLDQRWLRELPGAKLSATELENPGHRIIAKERTYVGGDLVDSVRRYKLPWVLIATADAYPAGNSNEQAVARRWVENALANPSDLTRDVADIESKHVGAELLVALRYLRGDKDFF